MDSQEQQTQKSFNEKWTKNSNLALEATISEQSEIFKWILSRNGFQNSKELAQYLSSKKRILDAGCGNGRVTKLLRLHSNPETTEVVGIDFSSHLVATENLQI
jgi:SAM-dependent methyltransferase